MITEEMDRLIRWALEEDFGSGDVTSAAAVPAEALRKAVVVAKEPGILAGIEVAVRVFAHVDAEVRCTPMLHDGDRMEQGAVVLEVEGPARSVLGGERVALNFLQRMCGISTRTSEVVASLAHTSCKVLDTRKTTPGLRAFEKYAVRVGGGVNHRMGLYDMVLIKDNHVDFAGNMAAALSGVRTYLDLPGSPQVPVVVEVRNEAELEEARAASQLLAGPDGVPLVARYLLDNWTPEAIRPVVAARAAGEVFEASGGIEPATAVQFGDTGVDFISMGWLTHSVPGLDLSMKHAAG
jgi:nicotinate-nucleotide pyrophosphorylase (carboxylating)